MKNSVFVFRFLLPASSLTYSSAFEMEAIYSTETSVDVHRAIWRYIPEGRPLSIFMWPWIHVASPYVRMALVDNVVTCSVILGHLTVLFQASNWVQEEREIQHWACCKTLEELETISLAVRPCLEPSISCIWSWNAKHYTLTFGVCRSSVTHKGRLWHNNSSVLSLNEWRVDYVLL
jgi:hypothetical protein